jgi:hypothetical protein
MKLDQEDDSRGCASRHSDLLRAPPPKKDWLRKSTTMFICATERLRIQLVSHECEAEGHMVDLLDRTFMFTQTILRPKIKGKAEWEEWERRWNGLERLNLN